MNEMIWEQPRLAAFSIPFFFSFDADVLCMGMFVFDVIFLFWILVLGSELRWGSILR